MQSTIRRIPKEIHKALRLRARREGKSLNEVPVEALGQAAGVAGSVRYGDLSAFLGSWVHDDETERVLEEQRQPVDEHFRRIPDLLVLSPS